MENILLDHLEILGIIHIVVDIETQLCYKDRYPPNYKPRGFNTAVNNVPAVDNSQGHDNHQSYSLQIN